MENKGRNDIMNIDLEAQVIEIGNIMLDIELIKKAYDKIRQAEGIADAKVAGVHMGRPKLIVPDNFLMYYNMVSNKEITATNAAIKMNISRASYYRIKKQYESGSLVL